jgi:shikimate kinase
MSNITVSVAIYDGIIATYNINRKILQNKSEWDLITLVRNTCHRSEGEKARKTRCRASSGVIQTIFCFAGNFLLIEHRRQLD